MLWLDNGHLTDILDIFGTFIGRTNKLYPKILQGKLHLKGAEWGQKRDKGAKGREGMMPEMEKIQRGSRQERLQPFPFPLCSPEKRGRGASGGGGFGRLRDEEERTKVDNKLYEVLQSLGL